MDTQLFDINIKLPIIRAENILNGIVSINNNDCNNNKHILDLPKPSFRPAENSRYRRRKSAAKKLAQKDQDITQDSYFHYQEPTPEELFDRVEYDMDDEDACWLTIFNDANKQNKISYQVSQDDFEKIMDRLEKESYFESQSSGKEVIPEIDEDAVCAICNGGKCDNVNTILFCDMCDLAVHQECYGVPYIPEGQWLCRRCLQSPSRNVECVLCPNKGGAFKQTDTNQWAHVLCALWIPEVCFANTVFLEPIDSLERIPGPRWKLCCYICKQKKIGACIQCHKPNCYVPFHVTCAQQAGLYMRIRRHTYITNEGSFKDVTKEAFCDAHTPKDRDFNGCMYSGDETEEEDLEEKTHKKHKKHKRPKKKDSMKKARKILAEKRALAFNPVACPNVKEEKLLEISKLLTINSKRKPPEKFEAIRLEYIERIKAYWLIKREKRNGVPLLRRLQVSFNNKSKADACNAEDLDKERYTRLRYDLEKARLLVGEVKKRELLKKKLFKYSMEIVENRYRLIDIEYPPIRE